MKVTIKFNIWVMGIIILSFYTVYKFLTSPNLADIIPPLIAIAFLLCLFVLGIIAEVLIKVNKG